MAQTLPPIPPVLFGVNQYNVGPPDLLARHWPLTDDDAAWLKSLGCNTIRFPLYPSEVGIDERRFLEWPPDGSFDPSLLGPPDWRSLDALMEWMIRHQFTPNVCPSPEVRGDWTTKTWMSLHLPEHAERTAWFTLLVVEHLTQRFGDRMVYGWYENWWWNTYKHPRSSRFPHAFRRKLAELYGHRIDRLNRAWNSRYSSFDDVEVPHIMTEDGRVDPAAIHSRRTYDLRRTIDLMQRDVLARLRKDIHAIAPGAVWAGGCLLNQIGALADIRSCTVPSCGPSMRTAAVTGDCLSGDLYSDSLEYYIQYRTLSKFAAVAGNRLLIAEVPAIKPRAFRLVADVGGPSAGALAWCGREDQWGLIRGDGSRRRAFGDAWKRLGNALQRDRRRYGRYRPGQIYVYFPEETLNYTISDRNHVDALLHLCDTIMPEELELVLTDELTRVPSGHRIYVLERTLPRRAIRILQRMPDRVVCLHPDFQDEYGVIHRRSGRRGDLYRTLLECPEGARLLDVFQRVEEKTANAALWCEGAQIRSSAQLAERNDVLPDRPNDWKNLIDGSYVDGVTLADHEQEETLTVELPRSRRIYGAFVDLFAGDGQFIPASRRPAVITVSVSTDGIVWRAAAEMLPLPDQNRVRCRFTETEARHVRFACGRNTAGRGLRLVELGVLAR